MMGVYHKTTQSLEISLDIFSIDENYLDDDCESIPSLLCHDEYIKPQHIIYVNNIIILLILVLCFFLRLLRRQQQHYRLPFHMNPVYAPSPASTLSPASSRSSVSIVVTPPLQSPSHFSE